MEKITDDEKKFLEQRREYEKRKAAFLSYIEKGMEKYGVKLIVDLDSSLKAPKIIIV